MPYQKYQGPPIVVRDERNLQKKVKKVFYFKNCSDLSLFEQIVLVASNILQILWPPASNFKSCSQFLEQFFLAVGHNNFENKESQINYNLALPDNPAAKIRSFGWNAFFNSLNRLTNPSLSLLLPFLQSDCQHTGNCHSNDKPSNFLLISIFTSFFTKFDLF